MRSRRSACAISTCRSRRKKCGAPRTCAPPREYRFMYPASFEYHDPATVKDALSLLQKHGENAKLLAGGHSLIPLMKLRLASPPVIIDLGRVAELTGIREDGGAIAIGAMTTHHAIESSPVVRAKAPLLAEVAS